MSDSMYPGGVCPTVCTRVVGIPQGVDNLGGIPQGVDNLGGIP